MVAILPIFMIGVHGSMKLIRVIQMIFNKLNENYMQSFAPSTVTSTVQGIINDIKSTEGGYTITVEDIEGKKVIVKTTAQTRLFYAGILLTATIDLSNSYHVKILFNQNGDAALVRVLADSKREYLFSPLTDLDKIT